MPFKPFSKTLKDCMSAATFNEESLTKYKQMSKIFYGKEDNVYQESIVCVLYTELEYLQDPEIIGLIEENNEESGDLKSVRAGILNWAESLSIESDNVPLDAIRRTIIRKLEPMMASRYFEFLRSMRDDDRIFKYLKGVFIHSYSNTR